MRSLAPSRRKKANQGEKRVSDSLGKATQKDLIEEVTFKLKPEGQKEPVTPNFRGKGVPGPFQVSAKAPQQDQERPGHRRSGVRRPDTEGAILGSWLL